jgi:sigma-E factor negative regulatory protein RseC
LLFSSNDISVIFAARNQKALTTPGTIIHPGIIDSISDGVIRVKILSQSACSTCQAQKVCNIAEMEEKIVEIDQDQPGQWHSGQQVMVSMNESLGSKAVILGYVVPIFVLVVSIVVFLSVIRNEGLAALLSLLMLGPYYLLLYLFRDRLKKEFRFRIEKDEQ